MAKVESDTWPVYPFAVFTAVTLGAGSHVVIVCVLACLLSGHRSIYPAQRLLSGKGGTRLMIPTALRELTATRAPAPPQKEGAP